MTLFPYAGEAFPHASQPWQPTLSWLLEAKADEISRWTMPASVTYTELTAMQGQRIRGSVLTVFNDTSSTVTIPYLDHSAPTETKTVTVDAGGSVVFDEVLDSVGNTVFVADISGIDRARFAKFGLDACEWPTTSKMTAQKDAIIRLFNERFMFRKLGIETLERWQYRLQYRLDVIAPKYERAFQLYADNADLIKKVMQSVTVTSSSENRSIDTPDTVVNASDDYADRLGKTSASSTTELEPEGGVLENIDRSIDEWRNLADDFVGEFENLFLNVFDY